MGHAGAGRIRTSHDTPTYPGTWAAALHQTRAWYLFEWRCPKRFRKDSNPMNLQCTTATKPRACLPRFETTSPRPRSGGTLLRHRLQRSFLGYVPYCRIMNYRRTTLAAVNRVGLSRWSKVDWANHGRPSSPVHMGGHTPTNHTPRRGEPSELLLDSMPTMAAVRRKHPLIANGSANLSWHECTPCCCSNSRVSNKRIGPPVQHFSNGLISQPNLLLMARSF